MSGSQVDNRDRCRHGVRRAPVRTRGGAAVLVLALGAGLSGCAAVDRVVWGADGYAVKTAARDAIAAAQEGEEPDWCEGMSVDLGDPAGWSGAGAGEPEPFQAPWWPQDVQAVGPEWEINVEVDFDAVRGSDRHPGSLAFRAEDGGWCLAGHQPATTTG